MLSLPSLEKKVDYCESFIFFLCMYEFVINFQTANHEIEYRDLEKWPSNVCKMMLLIFVELLLTLCCTSSLFVRF